MACIEGRRQITLYVRVRLCVCVRACLRMHVLTAWALVGHFVSVLQFLQLSFNCPGSLSLSLGLPQGLST